MIKKYLILLIIFFICYNSYGQINNSILKNCVIKNELNLSNLTLCEALNILSYESKISIIASDDIKDISLDILFQENENLENILNSIAKIHNLRILSNNGIFILLKKENITTIFSGKIIDEEFNFGINNVKITLLNSYSPSTYSAYGGNFVLNDITPGVYLAKFEKEGYITKGEIINLSKENINLKIFMEKDKDFKYLDSHTEKITSSSNNDEILTINYSLKNNECLEVQNLLKELFQEDLKVIPLIKKNTLIITGKKLIVDSSRKLLEELDKEVEQIRITSQILDVSDNLFETLGFSWIYGNNKNNQSNDWSLSFLNSSFLNGVGNTYTSGIGIIKQFNNGNDILNLGINLLESTQDLVVSAKPSILVIDGKEGVFKVTEEIIVGEEKYENDNNNKTTYTPIFKEAGIILKVTPQIKENGFILLKVIIEVSNFKLKTTKEDNEASGTFNSKGGSKVGRSIETTVKIKDGETIFIGGLKKATIHNLNSSVPFFGTLPMVDFFFKNQNISHEITDIYIKLKVDIVKNENETFEKDELHQKAQNIINKKIY